MNKIQLSQYPRISVTGTKGKTTVIRLLEAAYAGIFDDILRVDTSGAYLNGACMVDENESRNKWGLTTTNAPGRFLGLIKQPSNLSLLECTVYNAITGLAYKTHDVGIFTNVFEDHIGSTTLLKSKQDIANYKSFIFSHIKDGGMAIYNADDTLVVEQLDKISSDKTNSIGVSLINELPNSCVVKNGSLKIIDDHGKEIFTCSTTEFPWLIDDFAPLRYSLGFVVATLYATLDEHDFIKAIDNLRLYKFDENGGRMVVAQIINGPKVILDFAHEKYSLVEVAKLGHHLAGKSGRVIGVLRLAPSRTDELITDTAKHIAEWYDEYVIYDKVDGHYRKPGSVKGVKGKNEAVGKVAELFSSALSTELGSAASVYKIIREDEAISKAISLSLDSDVIIYIANDDSARSLKFLQAAAINNGYIGVKIL